MKPLHLECMYKTENLQEISILESFESQKLHSIPGEPEKVSTFANSWHKKYFTDFNDSNSG